MRVWRLIGLSLVGVALVLWGQGYRAGTWVAPGSGEPIPGFGEYGDPAGTLGTVIDGGTVESSGHPFFTALGTNGRACVSCHQPAWGMSISADSLRDRWDATYGADPVFAAFDGANCPNLPPAARSSHSLLLERGLFRIPIAWPPRNADGSPKAIDFDIEVIHDPTGCNRNAQYGLASANPTVSVYRRPRPAANLKYVTAGEMNFMADAREATLTTQALSAVMGHEEASAAPSADVLRRIVEFESSVYAAQQHVFGAGFFNGSGIPLALGPRALFEGKPAKGPVFGRFDAWDTKPGDHGYDAFRASAARGAALFQNRQFALDGTAHSPAARGSCATCHSAALTGLAPRAGWMDIGTTTQPLAAGELPVFKITCKADAPPHPYLGRVIHTSDPGRALISGHCADVGSIVMQQLRGLAARAPYFANGSADTLLDVVDFYDRRYRMKLTKGEKMDLVHFMEAL